MPTSPALLFDMKLFNNYNKVFFLALILIFQTLSLHAQVTKDAVENDDFVKLFPNLNQTEQYKNNAEILQLLLEGQNFLQKNNANKALKSFQEAYKMSKKLSFQVGMVDAQIQIGQIYYNWGQYDKALLQYIETRTKAMEIGYDFGSAFSCNYMGKYWHTKGDFGKSMDYFNEGLLYALSSNDNSITSEIYRNIGNYYNTIGNHSKALEALFKSLTYIDENENPMNFASSCNHIGNVYQDMENLSQALHFHRKALEIRKKMKYAEGIGKSLRNLGEVYEQMQKIDSAEIFYVDAQGYFEQTGYQKGIIKTLLNLGSIALQRNLFEKAKGYFKNAIEKAKEIGYKKGWLNAQFSLGKVYLNSGQTLIAKEYFLTAFQGADENRMLELKKQAAHSLYELSEKQGKIQDALQFYKIYATTNDSIKSNEHQQNIDELIMRYNISAKEKENEFLKRENLLNTQIIAKKNISIILSVFAILSLIFIVFFIHRNLKRKKRDNITLRQLNQQQNELNAELNLVNAEKDKLYSIFVHELRNPLIWFRNITQTLLKNHNQLNPEKLKKALEALEESATQSYHLLDNLLQWTQNQLGRTQIDPVKIDLKELMEESVKFAEIALKYKNIQAELELDSPVIVKADRMMLNTVVRNLISNAIKYTRENGKIQIKLSLSDNSAIVSISDNGIGIAIDDQSKIFDSYKKFSKPGIMQEKGSGIGLLLCKDFVEKNHGTISFKSDINKGSEFTFVLPVLN